MHALREVNAEPVPGYRLLEPLGKGGFGEVWKCQAPGGFLKAMKFVGGDNGLDQAGSNAEQELRALEHLKSLRHPFLLSVERVEVVGADLVIITELADCSLHDLLQQHRQAGSPGIPRAEVLAYLREAAEVLDVMNQEHGLQHLDIKPGNLFLVSRHVKVADFGLVATLADVYSRTALLGGITPLYAAPELFEGRATLYSDQYSLAVTYHELLTGHPIFEGRSYQQLLMLVSSTDPDLSRLAEADQAAVRRALSKNPAGRFPSCTAFVEALAAGPSGPPFRDGRTTTAEFHLSASSATSSNATAQVPRVTTPPRTASETVLPGYQLTECLTRGKAGELWRARGPRGDGRLVRFITPPPDEPDGSSPLARLLGLKHDSLAELEAVPVAGGRVALITEAGDSSLAQRFKECRSAGQIGVPRLELLRHFAQLTQTVDELYAEHELQHLGLTPRHLSLSRGDPILLEFGQTELLWIPAGIQPAELNPRYSAPELFDGLVSDASDQFSLALIYQELLVGLHPYRNLNGRQMASARTRGGPDVSLLPGSDRPIVLRALSPEPEARFRSCREFAAALEEVTHQAEHRTVSVPVSQTSTRQITPVTTQAFKAAAPPAWRTALDELVAGASRGHEIRSAGTLYYRLTPGHGVEHRCWARLAPGMGKLKVLGFKELWKAALLDRGPSNMLFGIRQPASLWQRLTGRIPRLTVEVVFGSPREQNGQLTPVRVTVQAVNCSRTRASDLLSRYAGDLLVSLQDVLSSACERAGQERFPLQQAAHVGFPVAGVSVTGQVRDVGRAGMAVLTDRQVPVGAARVVTARWGSPQTFEATGWVRECRPLGKQFEVEVEFPG